jgi:hypothetical protein
MAHRSRVALLPLLLAGATIPASACLPPPLAVRDGEVVAGDGAMPLRAQFGADAGKVQAVPLRHMFGSVDEAARLEALRDDRPGGEISEPVTLTTLGDGGTRWSFVLSGGTLAVAQTVPEYRLLDALTVQTDPGGSPAMTRAFVLAPATPALLIANAHHNSQEGFVQHTLLALVDGTLQPVWDGPLLYSFSTGDEACDLRRVEQALATFAPAPAGAGWPAIAVGVLETESCEKDGRVEPAQPREFATVLQFDPATDRYAGALPELEALNGERRGD